MEAQKLPQLNIYIFHYHLLPGGVTDVIMGWLRILARYVDKIFPQYRQIALHVCCGRPDNIANLQKQWQIFVKNYPQQQLATLDFIVDPELDYKTDEQAECAQVKNLATHLLRRYAADEQEILWWIHNYHIGKNIVYTEALLQIIENHQPASLRFLLHIHDFPECGRFASYNALLHAQNLRNFSKNTGRDLAHKKIVWLYPQTENLCYAVINQRDYHILRAAGCKNLFFLPNPLELAQPEKAAPFVANKGEERLRQAFARDFGLADKTLALYPVRCIRRKNVLELGLLNLLAGEPWNLVCTLPGLSAPEKAYSGLVETLFAEGVLCGIFGVGLKLEERGWSFDMLCRASDLIVSSSVLEGFGFAYFQPMLWGKFLLARKLDVLEGFRACFAPELTHFYCELKIPLHSSAFPLTESYRELRERYLVYFTALPAWTGNTLQQQLTASLPPQPPENLDFALFPVETQCRILRYLHNAKYPRHYASFDDSGSFLAECQQSNQKLLKELERLKEERDEKSELLEQARRRSRTEIERTFAPERLAELLQRACNPTNDERVCAETEVIERSCKILEAFSRLEYNYALLWEDADYSGM